MVTGKGNFLKGNFLSDGTGEPAGRNGEKFILFKIFSFTMTTV